MTKQKTGTAALRILAQSGLEYRVLEYAASAQSEAGFALDAAAKLGVNPDVLYKTLVAQVEGVGPVIAVIAASAMLNLKRLAEVAGGKRAEMADLHTAQRLSGYVAGGISPLGTRTELPVFLDEGMWEHPRIIVSAGKRGLSVEISPSDLASLIPRCTRF